MLFMCIARAAAISIFSTCPVIVSPKTCSLPSSACFTSLLTAATRAAYAFFLCGRFAASRPCASNTRPLNLPNSDVPHSPLATGFSGSLTNSLSPRYKNRRLLARHIRSARNPSSSAPLWRYRLGVRTPDSQSGNPGSIPGTATNHLLV